MTYPLLIYWKCILETQAHNLHVLVTLIGNLFWKLLSWITSEYCLFYKNKKWNKTSSICYQNINFISLSSYITKRTFSPFPKRWPHVRVNVSVPLSTATALWQLNFCHIGESLKSTEQQLPHWGRIWKATPKANSIMPIPLHFFSLQRKFQIPVT